MTAKWSATVGATAAKSMWPVSAILMERTVSHITVAEVMDEVALEALVRIPKLRTAEQCEILTGKNGSLSGKRNLFNCLKEEKEQAQP